MSADDRHQRPYVESPVIMTTVRVLAPFVMTYGLFVMFHGADSSGGGFQGGTIVAAMVIMLAFAYGIDPTARWLSNDVLVGLAGVGVLTFVGIGLGAMVLGGAFLEYVRYGGVPAAKYGIELVELSIGAIVASVLVGLFFAIVGGFDYQWGEDELIDLVATRYTYLAAILLVGIGLYMLIQIGNLVFKVIGLNIFQTGIFLFFITTGFVAGGRPPVIGPGSEPYVSPLPHVLILTAIVVGVSLTAVALVLVVRIYAEYGTLQADVVQAVSADE